MERTMTRCTQCVRSRRRAIVRQSITGTHNTSKSIINNTKANARQDWVGRSISQRVGNTSLRTPHFYWKYPAISVFVLNLEEDDSTSFD